MLFNEPKLLKSRIRKIAYEVGKSFSALQRAEIAEILQVHKNHKLARKVSVLFNEPKLLKCEYVARFREWLRRFSALQRAEIAEMKTEKLQEC